MSQIGTPSNPLRVAIIGAGPAGFYTAEQLLRHKSISAEIDLFERLPAPFGLVRYGVAPDHQKIKGVTKVFSRVADRPNVRYFGNVELGRDLLVADLRNHYHQIVYTVGAQTDRPLNIPGIDLAGSHAATEFVAWYNGHPDYRDRHFDLTQERVAIIGVGNVALDVARILCLTPDELRATDAADYAIDALSQSNVREVVVLGRRGPAQAKFTVPELKELGEMAGASVCVPKDEAALDPVSQAQLDESGGRDDLRKVELIQQYANAESEPKPRHLILRFLVSVTQLDGDDLGRVQAMHLVRNALYPNEWGGLSAKSTGETEVQPVGLIFRSVGYRGEPLLDVPFDASRGVIPNEQGRVLSAETGDPLIGEYTAGWIKRGPSGVIGTNKADAAETVTQMVADCEAGRLLTPSEPDPTAVEALIADRQPQAISFDEWKRLDEMEVALGREAGRPRIKFTDVNAMLRALNKSS